MTNIAIVALPREDEYVNDVSSEDVAHLTLVSLGDQDIAAETLVQIVEYVEHAASQLSPFGMSVDYRGELGEKKADVLFFEKSRWGDHSRIASFRGHLLQNHLIKTAYDSVSQFPEWTPHLTLGYPEEPAKEVDEDHKYGLRYVSFDRIAIWIGDSEGPTFRLKYEDDYAMDGVMAHSAALGLGAVRQLFHYGVRGMKWGVRKSERGAVRRGATKANTALSAGAAAIEKGERKLIFLPASARVKAASATQSRVLGEAVALNQDAKYKGKDLKKDPDLKAAYHKEIEKRATKIYKEELNVVRVEVAIDVLHTLTVGRSQERLEVRVNKDSIRHAEEEETLLALEFKFDELGQISDVTVPESFLKHEETDDGVLVHYGVPGMRWGYRKGESTGGRSKADPSEVSVTQTKPGQFAKTTGGKKLPLHEDAKTALTAKQKAKGSTTDALSNAELRVVVERMRLEREYNQLAFSNDRRSKGARFAAGLFGAKKPTKFVDTDEESGEKVRKIVDDILEARKTKTS